VHETRHVRLASSHAMMRSTLCVSLLAVLSSCAPRSTGVPISPASASLQVPYIDLRPGWRLHVVTPLTKSGSYQLGPAQQRQDAGTLSVTAEDDFLGYETSFYSVQPRGRSGVRITFTSAEETKNGVTSAEAARRVRLFELSPRAKYVRLLYLARVSRSDHDMAVVAASKQELLAAKTVEVQANPQACQNVEQTFCSWIPAGIAVRAEMKSADGSQSWTPVH
jgi:hypothetical protein